LKKTILLSLILLLSISCKKEIYAQQKTTNFKNDLETKYLNGKVKECNLFIAFFTDSDKSQTENPVTILKEKFTEKGFFERIEYYDYYGEVSKTIENFYNDNDYLLKSISVDENSSQKTVELNEYDTIKKTENKKIIINNKFNYKLFSTFGKFNKIEKQIRFGKEDTTVINYNYKFNSKNNVIRKVEFHNNSRIISEYKYDKKENIIESI